MTSTSQVSKYERKYCPSGCVLWQLGGFFHSSPACPKQPRTSFLFYKFVYLSIWCIIYVDDAQKQNFFTMSITNRQISFQKTRQKLSVMKENIGSFVVFKPKHDSLELLRFCDEFSFWSVIYVVKNVSIRDQ